MRYSISAIILLKVTKFNLGWWQFLLFTLHVFLCGPWSVCYAWLSFAPHTKIGTTCKANSGNPGWVNLDVVESGWYHGREIRMNGLYISRALGTCRALGTFLGNVGQAFITATVSYKGPWDRVQPTLGRLEQYHPASAARLRAELPSHNAPLLVYKLEWDRIEAAL